MPIQQGRGERRGHRPLHRLVVAECQHGHARSDTWTPSRPGLDRRAVQGRPGEKHPAARGDGCRGHQADRRRLRADVHLLQLEGDERVADQRLPHARGAAETADHQRRRQRADARRPGVRHAHVARSGPHGVARGHGARRAGGACRQQLHLGPRPGEGRLRPDQYRRQDLARRSGGLRAARGHGTRRLAGPAQRCRRDRARPAKLRIPRRCSTG